MRTITIEEHFLARGFREVMQSNALSQGGGSNPYMTAERLMKLADLDTLRLQDMDTGGIDLQVISDTGSVVAPRPGDEGVKLAQESNDQLAAAIAAHPDRFAGFATLPMMKPEAAADELERAVRLLGLKGPMIFGTTNGRFWTILPSCPFWSGPLLSPCQSIFILRSHQHQCERPIILA